jgi:ParB family chromosome partitioning protein
MKQPSTNTPRINLTALQLIDLDKIDGAPDHLALRPLDLKRVEAMKKTMLESESPPVTARAKSDGRYELLDGHHRVAAARGLKVAQINAVVLECDEQDALQFAVTSNINRKNLTGPQLAAALEALRKSGGGTLRRGLREIANALGTSDTRLKRAAKIKKKLGPDCRAAYEAAEITEDGANELSKLLPGAQTEMLEDAKKVKAGTLKRDVFRARVADRRRRDANLPLSSGGQEQEGDGDLEQLPANDRHPCWKVVEFEKAFSAADVSKLGPDVRRDLVVAATAAAASVNRLLQRLMAPEVSTAGGDL